MTVRYYMKAKNTKEELLARFCTVLNVVTRSERYGLTKGWDIAQIVTKREYEKRRKEEGAEVLADNVIMITKE